MEYKDECNKLIEGLGKNLGYDVSILSRLEETFGKEFDALNKSGYRGPKLNLVVGLEDTCKNAKNENLTLEQIKAIKRVVDVLYRPKEITNQDVKKYLNSLIKVGLMPIPRLERLYKCCNVS